MERPLRRVYHEVSLTEPISWMDMSFTVDVHGMVSSATLLAYIGGSALATTRKG